MQRSWRIENQYTEICCISIHNNKLSEWEIKWTIPVTMRLIKIKYLRIHLTKEVKDLYSENWKTTMQEIEDDTNGKIYCAHRFEEFVLLKWFHTLRQSSDLMSFLSKYQWNISKK